ncbi:hypothetical protein SAMN04488020_101340 [Palleronia marisminoris]|uniref:Lipoprotein n=1 Tax=Palleronia marisminoris TaxID=315423 RepID=A0A1Y5REP1_9RHOB|nr:hypothetical protein [Palleronia marisminoris]SFG15570.1 hypothetical protein SAMN04488020_101340 [Palleronia marisminoris]SLN15700.1 hypothetical protein PAM7066_00340 [Palleronia marisminoris]
MIHRLFLAAPLALLACAPTTDQPATSNLSVNADGAAAAAQTPPALTAVAQALDARQGQMLTPDLEIRGASAEGDTLVMQFRHAQPSTAFGPAAREGYEVVAARSIREQLCAAPATARFVETYGVAATIVTSDDQPLATVNVDDC